MNNNRNDIVKSNALVEACYTPSSLWQMRLLLAALTQIKSADKLNYKQEFTVTAGGLAELSDTHIRANYRHLARAADELMHMVITVPYRPNGDGRQLRKRKINVVSACDYAEGEGCVKLYFTPHIIPYISSLASHFTKYKAQHVMHMRSGYGIRLYELCLQWSTFGNAREFEVAEFKQLLGLENKYKRIEQLKRVVIFPAIKDINERSNICVKFGQRKAGRIITHFQFVIEKQDDDRTDMFANKLPAQKKKITVDEYVSEHPSSTAGLSRAALMAKMRNEGISVKTS